MADVRSLDIEPLATVELSDGRKLDIPRLTTVKLIRIAKFIAIDGMKIYEKYRNVLDDSQMEDAEKVSIIVSELTDEQIIRLLAILLGISDEEALKIDPFDNLEIITTYVENTDVERAFTNVQKLMKKFKGQNMQANQTMDENQPQKFGTVGTS
ncbi:hypothetical protein [Halobacillus sp. H74]|uniref:hypothetical protein n=1 Tax=Halobacillus sp. H74 TaxID=3457436 RepID=UPI003FCEB203